MISIQNVPETTKMFIPPVKGNYDINKMTDSVKVFFMEELIL